jgi:hypothetical protein
MNEPDHDTIQWLLTGGPPGVRYLTLRDLLERPPDDPELRAALTNAHREGAIPFVLGQMHPDGYWVEPGPGYNPKYTSTVWSLILLAQLGARMEEDERVGQACAYVLEHTLTPGGQFSSNGPPSGTIDCLQGNLCWSLLELGCSDPRLDLAFEWMARSVTGTGIAPATDRQAKMRYYAGKCGPLFACGANVKLSCAWGAAKVMLAFARLPIERRTPLIEQAIEAGVNFLFSVDPAQATYPSGWTGKPSQNWWKFGFPVFYVTDLLQIVEALVKLGYGADPRLANALSVIRDKQTSDGSWLLEYDYNGKTWLDFGAKKQPNRWITLRAMRALHAAGV